MQHGPWDAASLSTVLPLTRYGEHSPGTDRGHRSIVMRMLVYVFALVVIGTAQASGPPPLQPPAAQKIMERIIDHDLGSMAQSHVASPRLKDSIDRGTPQQQKLYRQLRKEGTPPPDDVSATPAVNRHPYTGIPEGPALAPDRARAAHESMHHQVAECRARPHPEADANCRALLGH
jgi:hypothetical protein